MAKPKLKSKTRPVKKLELAEGACETVEVEADNDEGYMVINKSDYDSSKHTLYKEDE